MTIPLPHRRRPGCRRPSRLLARLAIAGALALMTGTAYAAPAAPAVVPFLAGGDISLLTREEQFGQLYRDNGQPKDLLEIFKSHGANCMRLRLWVDPKGTDIYVSDLAYTMALGKRIKQAGLYFLLDIHYSDSWADPGKQTKPAAWAKLSVDKLRRTVHDYTRDVIAAMRVGGAMPDMVQIGNEVSAGMLWPEGKDYGPGHDFKNFGAFLKAGIQGVKDGSGDLPTPPIMIHIDKGGDWEGTRWFFDNLRAQGVNFDIIGESYYPFFHGPMSQLKTTLENAAARYGKPIVVVETGFAYRADGRDGDKPVNYPRTPEGQRQFLHDLMATVRATPGGLGRGVIYWAPEWIPVKGLQGSWNGTTLFDDDGNALPGLAELSAAETAR